MTNNGTSDLHLGTVPGTALIAPFSVGTNNCSGQTLAVSSSCTVQVVFQPTALGAAAGTFEIPSDDPDTATVHGQRQRKRRRPLRSGHHRDRFRRSERRPDGALRQRHAGLRERADRDGHQ